MVSGTKKAPNSRRAFQRARLSTEKPAEHKDRRRSASWNRSRGSPQDVERAVAGPRQWTPGEARANDRARGWNPGGHETSSAAVVSNLAVVGAQDFGDDGLNLDAHRCRQS